MTDTITAEQRAILLGHAAGRYTADIAAELGLTLGEYLSRRGRLLVALAIAVARGIVNAADLRRVCTF